MTIIPLEFGHNEKLKKEQNKVQSYEMALNQINNSQSNYTDSINAKNDKYIFDAMKKVSKSVSGINEDLSRRNGSFFFNNPSSHTAAQKSIRALTDKEDNENANDYKKTLYGQKLIKKFGNPDELKVMMNIKSRHDTNGQLGIRHKKIRNKLIDKYKNRLQKPIKIPEVKVEKITHQKEELLLGVKPRWKGNKRTYFNNLNESLQVKTMGKFNKEEIIYD